MIQRISSMSALALLLGFAAIPTQGAAAEKTADAVVREAASGHLQELFVTLDDHGLRAAWLAQVDSVWADVSHSEAEKRHRADALTADFTTQLAAMKRMVMADHPRVTVVGSIELGPEVIVQLSNATLLQALIDDARVLRIDVNGKVTL